MHPDNVRQIVTAPSTDADYHFGRPSLYLSTHDLVRLLLLRSSLGETRAEREAEGVRSARLRRRRTRAGAVRGLASPPVPRATGQGAALAA